MLVLALALGTLVALAPFLPGLLGAAMLAVVAGPAHHRLSRYLGARGASAVLVALAALLVLLPLTAVVVTLTDRAPAAMAAVGESDSFQRLRTLRVGTIDVGTRIGGIVDTFVAWASGKAMSAVGGISRGALNLVIALCGLYFALVSGSDLWRDAKRLLPFADTTSELLRQKFHDVTLAVLLGILLTAAAQGLVVGIAFAAIGIPNAAFWGVVTAFFSVLPVFGSALVWFPGSVMLLLEHRPGAALTLGLIGLVVASNIDNVLRPVVLRRVAQLHPMLTLLGAIGGVSFFGVAGVLLGPLALCFLVELVRVYHLGAGGGTAGAVPAP